jgi:hypothetical protein
LIASANIFLLGLPTNRIGVWENGDSLNVVDIMTGHVKQDNWQYVIKFHPKQAKESENQKFHKEVQPDGTFRLRSEVFCDKKGVKQPVYVSRGGKNYVGAWHVTDPNESPHVHTWELLSCARR